MKSPPLVASSRSPVLAGPHRGGRWSCGTARAATLTGSRSRGWGRYDAPDVGEHRLRGVEAFQDRRYPTPERRTSTIAEPTSCCAVPGGYCARVVPCSTCPGVQVTDVGWRTDRDEEVGGDQLVLSVETGPAPVRWWPPAIHDDR